MYYIESKKRKNKRWQRHLPGFKFRETAEKNLEEWEFHYRLDTKREYKITRTAE